MVFLCPPYVQCSVHFPGNKFMIGLAVPVKSLLRRRNCKTYIRLFLPICYPNQFSIVARATCTNTYNLVTLKSNTSPCLVWQPLTILVLPAPVLAPSDSSPRKQALGNPSSKLESGPHAIPGVCTHVITHEMSGFIVTQSQ